MNLNEYSRIRFLDKGRDRSGCDCWGLVKLVYAERFGIELPGYEEVYQHTKDKDAITTAIPQEAEKHWIDLYPDFKTPLELSKVRPRRERCGDVVLMRIMGLPWHVGIVGEAGKVLHVEPGTDSICEGYLCTKWERRILGFYRHASLCRRGNPAF